MALNLNKRPVLGCCDIALNVQLWVEADMR